MVMQATDDLYSPVKNLHEDLNAVGVQLRSLTIADEGTTSSSIYIADAVPVRLDMPSSGAWEAANLTFQASPDGTTWRDLYDKDGDQITITGPDVDYSIALNPAEFAYAGPYLRVVASAAQTTGAKVLTLYIRRVL